jgi:ABC-type branched-subunit amino acid transport system ATPase component/ABC-type branched-subunit amino acid transport system permease subunit
MTRRVAWVVALLALSSAGLLCHGYYQFLYYEIAAWSLLALSVDVLYGQAGMLSFGQSVFLALSGYVFLHLSRIAEVGLLGAALIAIATSILLAAALGRVMVRLEGHYFVIATVILALATFLVASSLTRWTGGDDGLPAGPFTGTLLVGVPLPALLRRAQALYFAVGLATAAMFGISWKLRKSALGLLVAGVKHEPFRMSALGYDVSLLKYGIWCLAAGVASLGGVSLIVVNRYASATQFHWSLSGEGVVWAILGGVDTVWGALLGTAVLVSVKDILSTQFAFYPIVVGVLLIALVHFRSDGLLRALAGLVGGARVWRRVQGKPQSDIRPINQILVIEKSRGTLLALGTVRKAFRGTVALDRCDLEIAADRFCVTLHDGRRSVIEGNGVGYPTLALVGPNGAGKTTLLNVLCGYLNPDGGEVSSDVFKIKEDRATEGIGRSFQEPRLWDRLSVYENLLLGTLRERSWRGLQKPINDDEPRAALAVSLASRLGLLPWLTKDASTLSFGKRKVLDIGVAVASRPKLLALDEPTAGVSPREVLELEGVIRELSLSLPIILVEHNFETIRRLDFPVLFMAEGRLIEYGSLSEVLSRDSVREQFSGLRVGKE